MRRFLLVLTLLLAASRAAIAQQPVPVRPIGVDVQSTGTLTAANAVLQRVMPHLASQIHLELRAGQYASGMDGFRITGTRGSIHISAASVPTLLFGVNWYLKYTAHLSISTNGNALGAPGLQLPAPAASIDVPAISPVRYALNENTDGYTTPYWSFDRWQHEIDILALSGFNAILIQRGNDLAVYQAFRSVGYSDQDIRTWITQPAHQNWQWMGNMCCFIEPISLDLMQQRAASARRILNQLRALGITPMLPGFWGVVPADFAQHVPGTHVVQQTDPWNGFQRPGWLDPRDPVFAKLAAAFYKAQQDLFGPTTLYDMETFQEGGQAGNVPIGAGAVAIQQSLNKAHPDALWFMMAWQDNPKPELLAAVDRHRILIADIEQGRIPRENREQEFGGAPWLFGGLWEFGGRVTMGAALYDYARRMPPMRSHPGSHLSGIALFTEGLDTNPFAFDLYTEMAWRTQPVDLAHWTQDYADRRYGAPDLHARNAWRIVQQTAYGYRADGDLNHGERDAAHESLFNAQPSLTAVRTGHWAPDVLRYNADDLRPALTELLQVAPALRTTPSYRYDIVEIARQVLANDARRQLPLLKAAYDAHDRALLQQRQQLWMHSMDLDDRLLGTSEYFLLGRWLSWVPAWAHSAADAASLNYDARSILTTWGDRTASQDLHEYGNRDWSGLVRTYYAPRWQLYFNSLNTALATNTAPQSIDWYAFGDAWNRSTAHYASQPTGDPYAQAAAVATLLGVQPKLDASPGR